jgi:outer membrane protein OmpA-like peptidoglycan-associated protein
VYERFRKASRTQPTAYVLWEPYVSKALGESGAHVLIGSDKLKGYIVDVLAARRTFLRDNPELVAKVVQAYLRAAYANRDNMAQLVMSDAKSAGEPISPVEAERLVKGIQWKNTLENYAHFGLATAPADNGVPHLEDIVDNIVDVLVKTKALPSDPLAGKHPTLFYHQILAELQREKFHPGKGVSLIPGLAPDPGVVEQVRAEQGAKALTPEQWEKLQPVGELRLEPIVFSRGSANISVQSDRDLQALARRLRSFPQFYLRVIGHTRAEGDPDANRALALARAEAAAQFLRGQGVGTDRMRTEAAPARAESGEGQAVSFVVGQVPY